MPVKKYFCFLLLPVLKVLSGHIWNVYSVDIIVQKSRKGGHLLCTSIFPHLDPRAPGALESAEFCETQEICQDLGVEFKGTMTKTEFCTGKCASVASRQIPPIPMHRKLHRFVSNNSLKKVFKHGLENTDFTSYFRCFVPGHSPGNALPCCP